MDNHRTRCNEKWNSRSVPKEIKDWFSSRFSNDNGNHYQCRSDGSKHPFCLNKDIWGNELKQVNCDSKFKDSQHSSSKAF